MTEVALSLLMVGIAVTLIVELNTLLIRQQRGLDRRVVAMQEAANILETLGDWPWDELTAERAAEVRLPPYVSESLLDAELRVAVADDAEAPAPARRIDVALSWRSADGGGRQSTALSAWRFKP